MMKATYVTRYSNSQLQIHFQGGLLLRLFGGLFLLVGGYFLYHLVMGIIDSIRYGQMLLVFPGTCLLVVMMLAFGIPGWLLALTRKHTVIDPVGREVLDVKDFLLYKQAKRYPVETFNQVVVSNEIRRMKESEHQNKTYLVYPVELTGTEGDTVMTAEMDNPSQALELGGQIAAMLGLPLKDETETVNEEE
jgi:hypothetical protein